MVDNPESPSTTRPFRSVELFVPFLLFLAIFSLTQMRNLSAFPDGTAYLNCIDAGRYYFHSTHLLFNITGHLWMVLWQVFGLHADSEIMVPLLNSLVGALLLSVVYTMLRTRLSLNRLMALSGTSLIAFSYVFWLNSVSVSSLMIPLFFMVLSVYLLTGEDLRPKDIYLAGITCAFAFLYHLPNVLFVPVVLTGLFIRRSRTDGFFRSALRFFIAYIPVAVGIYVLFVILVVHPHNIGEAWSWAIDRGAKYAPNAIFGLNPGTLLKALYGSSKSIIGVYWLLAIPSLKGIVLHALGQAFFITPMLFLVRNSDPRLASGLLVLSIIFAAIAISLFVLRLREFGRIWRHSNGLIPMACIWFAIYGVFYFFWCPSEIYFKLPQTLSCWLIFSALMGSGQSSHAGSRRAILFLTCLIALLLMVINFGGNISLFLTRDNDYYFHKIAPFRDVVGANDLLVLDESAATTDYADRYIKGHKLDLLATWLDSRDPDVYIGTAARRISDALRNNGRVFIMSGALDFQPYAVVPYGEGIKSISKLWDLYRSRWDLETYGDANVYVLHKDDLLNP